MAELTNKAGLRIKFDPKSVVAVADHDETGNLTTCVYGVTKTSQTIGESINAFLTRLGVEGSFAQLTRIPATSLWVSVDAVDYLRDALPTDSPGVGSVISVGGTQFEIVQLYSAAAAVLNASCNKF